MEFNPRFNPLLINSPTQVPAIYTQYFWLSQVCLNIPKIQVREKAVKMPLCESGPHCSASLLWERKCVEKPRGGRGNRTRHSVLITTWCLNTGHRSDHLNCSLFKQFPSICGSQQSKPCLFSSLFHGPSLGRLESCSQLGGRSVSIIRVSVRNSTALKNSCIRAPEMMIWTKFAYYYL